MERDIEATGVIIDAVAKAGGDLIRIQGVSFTVDDPSQYYVEARAEAVADAIDKAQQLADLAGIQLGNPFYISEGGGFAPIYRDYGLMAAEGAVSPPLPSAPGRPRSLSRCRWLLPYSEYFTGWRLTGAPIYRGSKTYQGGWVEKPFNCHCEA
jgi:hypothetical protein